MMRSASSRVLGLSLWATLVLGGCGGELPEGSQAVDEANMDGVEATANLELGSQAVVYNTGGDGLNLRRGAGTGFGVILTMPEGAAVKILAGPQASFYRVSYAGKEGYAHGNFLRPAAAAACPRRALLTSGLHPDASDQLRCAGIGAAQITQTIGDAPASAGYHARDGFADGKPYTAAVDISVRGLSEGAIRVLLGRLGAGGFAPWYRKPGSDGWPSDEAPHIHAIYVGCRMKSSLSADRSLPRS